MRVVAQETVRGTARRTVHGANPCRRHDPVPVTGCFGGLGEPAVQSRRFGTMDRFELLEWLVGREREGAPAPDGKALLISGEGWDEVARAFGELLQLGWVRADWMRWPGQGREPNPGYMTVMDMQQYNGLQVTEKGYAMESDRKPRTDGPTFNIHDSTIGQLAGGDINNLTIERLLIAVEQAIEQADGSDEEKQEARAMLGRAREAVLGVGSGAAGGVLAGAIKATLGIP